MRLALNALPSHDGVRSGWRPAAASASKNGGLHLDWIEPTTSGFTMPPAITSLIGNSLCSIALLAGAFAANADATERDEASSPAPGEGLFQQYGCSHCHGVDGATPAARYVPVIRGQASEKIFNSAREILQGTKSDQFSNLMHDHYCDARSPGPDCTHPPTDAQLQEIANWLAQPARLPGKKRTPQKLYLSSRDAYDLVRNNREETLFIDIRTRAEATYVGQPQLVDAHIPFAENDFDVWDERQGSFRINMNPQFIAHVREALGRKALDKDDRIILICRSGKRSAQAARVLYVSGFRNVYSVTDGFEGDKLDKGPYKGHRLLNGWKNADLPWTYDLDIGKFY
jgi:rhodanese-related sulfurtransferase/cytochrome c553